MITRSDQLPTRGALTVEWTEREDFDLKLQAKSFDRLELAKDAAAMANTLGGTILVGLTDEGGTIHAEGLTDKDFRALKERLEDALKDQCEPPLSAWVVPVRYEDSTLVAAINIDPLPDAPVACKSATADAWRFPIRRSSKTHLMSPMEFSMYMNPATRRAYCLLARIPKAHREKVCLMDVVLMTTPGREPLKQSRTNTGSIEQPSLEHNHVRLTIDQRMVAIPLADVLDVWTDVSDDRWNIVVKGTILLGRDPSYVPQPGPLR